MPDLSDAFVHYLDQTPAIDCPHGQVRRIVTGGQFGAPNMHLVQVTRGGEHFHRDYDELYYVISGTGELKMDGKSYELRPGAVVGIPAGVVHELNANENQVLEFLIVGLPGMPINDDRAAPCKPGES
jgi:mannose-6-phosphate isomerase-like protein (cupin superfamily)